MRAAVEARFAPFVDVALVLDIDTDDPADLVAIRVRLSKPDPRLQYWWAHGRPYYQLVLAVARRLRK